MFRSDANIVVHHKTRSADSANDKSGNFSKSTLNCDDDVPVWLLTGAGQAERCFLTPSARNQGDYVLSYIPFPLLSFTAHNNHKKC